MKLRFTIKKSTFYPVNREGKEMFDINIRSSSVNHSIQMTIEDLQELLETVKDFLLQI